MDFNDGKKGIDIRLTSTRKLRENGKNADGSPLTDIQKKEGIYDMGIQWFEPLADNYHKPLNVNPNIATLDVIKHFTWDEIANFAMIDRDMVDYRTGGSGDWKGSKQGGDGGFLVTVNGEPYWTDAIGQN